MSKTCPSCYEQKNCESFSKSKNRKDGLDAYCKQCQVNKQRVRRLNHPMESRERERRWRRRNPLARRTIQFNYRHNSKITVQDIDSILVKQNKKCAICKDDLSSGWHLDHIVPRSLGGSPLLSNLEALCKPCNFGKHDLSLKVYIEHCKKVAAKYSTSPVTNRTIEDIV